MRNLLIILFLGVGLSLMAQDQGGIPEMEIQIINPLKVTLPRAERNFSKVPAAPLEPITPPIEYSYSLVSFSTPSFSPPVRPLRIKPPETTLLPSNFISAGFGNYTSPYLKGYLSFFPAKRSEAGGLSFFHNSFGTGPIDGKNSAGGNTAISAHIKSANNQLATEALVGFESRANHFYGYAPDAEIKRDTIRQYYRTYFISAKFSNAKKQDFNYELRPSFSYLNDAFAAKESDLSLGINTSYDMKGKNQILFNASYSLITRKDTSIEAKPRHLFKITPQYQFTPIENLILKAGFTVAYENDSIGKKNLHVFPAASATYALSKRVGLFASLSGDVEKVSLHSLSAENIWVAPSIAINHSNKALELSGGLQADLGGGFGFSTGFSFARLKNFYVFQNSAVDGAKFNTLYDDIVRTNLFASINFDKGNYSFRLKGDYFTYSTDTLSHAWHRPKYKVDSYVVIKAGNKLSIVPRIMVLGGMQAFNWEEALNPVVDIKTAVDLSANIEYNFNSKAGAFLKLNNLLNSDYSLYYRYPVRGIQGTVGFTYRF
jgi:hypothetical protein